MKHVLLFSTSNYDYLKKEVANKSHAFILSDVYSKNFPDGESYHRLPKVSGKDIVLIGGTYTDSETLELYDMACGMVKQGANSLTIVIPYFGYSTMERAVKSGEIVKAKSRARILSSIPKASTLNTFMFVDLHSEGIIHYMEGDVRSVHLSARSIIVDTCLSLFPDKLFVFGSTDAGRAKVVESMANEMGVESALVLKRRISGSETKVTSINCDVIDKDVIIYDDMIRTGGSLIDAAKSYISAGAKSVTAVASHGVFPDNPPIFNPNTNNNIIRKLTDSGCFKNVIVTNSHPMSESITGSELLIVKSIAPIIYQGLLDHVSDI